MDQHHQKSLQEKKLNRLQLVAARELFIGGGLKFYVRLNKNNFYLTIVTSKNCAYRDSNSDLSLSSQALCRLVHSRPGH